MKDSKQDTTSPYNSAAILNVPLVTQLHMFAGRDDALSTLHRPHQLLPGQCLFVPVCKIP